MTNKNKDDLNGEDKKGINPLVAGAVGAVIGAAAVAMQDKETKKKVKDKIDEVKDMASNKVEEVKKDVTAKVEKAK